MQKISSWGYHLILDCGKCVPGTIRSKNNIRAFSADLVKKIDMIPYGPPRIVMFGDGNKKGYTLVQLIETSNIMAHFVEETDDIYLDVFSCKEFEPKVVEKVVDSYFGPQRKNAYFKIRQA